MNSHVFDGLRVIDCGSYIAAPASTTILADLGADVIKIEPPGMGDPYRQLPKLPGNPVCEHDFAWLMDAHSKRGIALNLADPDGQSVLHDLVASADVFVTNYPLKVRQKLHLDYETLAARNEKIIYGSFTGYGETGPESTKPGFDTTSYWARSGMMDTVRSDAGAVPARSVVGQGDHPSAMTMFAAVVTALYQRERTGKGTYVSSSLLANGLWANSYMATAALCGATFIPRPPREASLNALGAYYQCADGKWLILTILNEDRHWPSLATCLGRPDLIDHPDFASKPLRLKNARALVDIMDAAFASRERAHWASTLSEAGIVFDIVATSEDIPDDPQIYVNEMVQTFPDDERLKAVATPFRLAGQQPVPPRMPPSPGQHTDEILTELGYDTDRVATLRSSGAVA
ncbi:CoA transferase [Gordonia amarae]|uniref:CaiB/BaiF family protein n=2 Tax=Gordonia amarae TaxID=36821 RepID=G7GT40_9ACTN|nr:CoA transferase [Gordonia amarae]MCS3880109.1 formyl-CoA transferase [Gordonia amarae]QHN18480.1 CoA transferase [Gordonia amarae]QHN22962.1 CoA transferase [Gordonia amarae]QHN31864.1 CoA transferase [Gordonia amarae]QHN40611.1 CoA transferase [Gordonia amarae]